MNIKKVFLLMITPYFLNAAHAADKLRDSTLLPQEFKVYYTEKIVIANHPFEGSIEKILPTRNEFEGTPGCYIACYSHEEKQSVYPVGNNIFVMGQIRVPGHYMNKICQPTGFENKDISAEQEFKFKCEKVFPHQCGKSSCWAGGDTGGWFGS